MAKSRGLKYIGLGLTGLGDEECRILQAALSANSGSLVFISLGRNQITSQGAVALAQGLEQNTTVQYLNLAINRVGDDGAAAIVHCVQAREEKAAPLRCVWMAGNQCDPGSFSGCVVNSVFIYHNTSSAMEAYLA